MDKINWAFAVFFIRDYQQQWTIQSARPKHLSIPHAGVVHGFKPREYLQGSGEMAACGELARACCIHTKFMRMDVSG